MKLIFKTFILSVLVFAQVHFAFAQTASILPPAKTTFNDQNGKPLVNGTVDFYIPSTTTRKTTWQDAAETVPNANPVVLDPSGRALILGSGSYRQVVKDSIGNTIWDQVTSSAGSGGGSSPTSTGDGDLVGTIKPWAGLTAPNQYMLTNGQELSRTTYATLFTAITSTQSVFCSSGSPIITGFSDTTNFPIGASVEASCVVSGVSTIVAKSSSTLTLAANANVSENINATVFPWGNGNHSTTFNIPDFRGLIPVGNNNMGGVASSNLTTTFFGVANPNSIGGAGGSQSKVLLTANLPPITPAGTITNGAITITGNGTATVSGVFSDITPGSVQGSNVGSLGASQAASTFTGSVGGGTSTAFGIIPPSKTANYIIKVTPDSNSATASGVTSIAGMTGDIACGIGMTCTGNTISGQVFQQTQGSGSVAQTQNAKLIGAQLYPDDYGTVDRTGVTDMGALINLTISNAKTCSAAATAGNDVIRLRAGIYNITTPIIPQSCVSIIGDGRGKTVLLTNHATPFLQTSGSQLVHFNLKGVTFKDSGSHPSAVAMTFQVLQGSKIENIGFHGYTTGTAMNLSSNAVTVSSFDDNSGVWNSNNSIFNTFEDWVEDDSMATGIIIAGSLATPCNVASATNVVTLNTFKDIQLWGITAVGWDLVRAADTNQFLGNNIIRLIGTGGGVITPHASFNNIAVQLGDDNATCSTNNDIALERMMLTVSMGSPATSFVMFNAGNNTFDHVIDFQTDQPTSVNSGITAMAGVTGVCYGITGRNYLTPLDDGVGNIFQLELDQCKYRALMDGTTTKPAMVFAADLANGVYRPSSGVWAWGKGTTTLEMDGSTSGQAKITVPAVAGTPILTLPTRTGTFLTQTPGTPTIASGACGTGTNGTISGSNMSGIVTIGASATTTCTIGFSATLPAAPGACVIFPGNATAAAQSTTLARVGTPSTTQWVITGSALASTVYSYVCM